MKNNVVNQGATTEQPRSNYEANTKQLFDKIRSV